MTVYADYSDETQSKTIELGESITFNADYFSMNPPMTISAQIYKGGSLVYTFLNTGSSAKTYYNTYSYTPTSSGSFEIRVIGTDKINTDSEFLTLTVNSVVPPVNHAPVITSVPISQVNEGTSYSYHVIATDADGDTLVYSLTEHPPWLSINSATGVISGTAPFVSADTNFDVEVEVSDGTATDTQFYTLKVKNICETDTIPPVITVLGSNPVTVTQGSLYVDVGATAFDNVDGDITSHIVTVNPVNTNVIGTYTVTYNVEDAAGNHAVQKTRTVHVVTCPPPVNHAPIITSSPVTQVNEGATYSYDVQATDSDGDTLTYSLTEHPPWLSINSATGVISGTAPLVSSDTNFDVEVEVSDGHGGIDTQSYTLKVKNICDGDTTPPVITVIYPENKEYDTHTISLRAFTDEPAEMTFRLDEGAIIEMNNPSDDLFTYTLHDVSDGNHIITFYAEDLAGNTAVEYAHFSIETEEEEHEHEDGANGIRTISDIYYENKYFDQFGLNKTGTTTTVTPSKTYGIATWVLFYILIGLICLGIIFLVFLLVRNLRR